MIKVSPIKKYFEDTLYRILHEDKEPRYPLSPSAATNCMRQLWYSLKNYEEPGSIPCESFGTRKLLVFERGHRVEKQVCDWLAKVPELEVIENKERFPIVSFDGKDITGEIDRIVIDKKTGVKYILDVKSVNTRGFQEVKKSGKPKESHYYQVNTYLYSDWAKDQGLTHGMIYYENADTNDYEILEWEYDEAAAVYALDRLHWVYSGKNDSTPVPREFVRGQPDGNGWRCNPMYCQFYNYCYFPITHSKEEKTIEEEDKELEILNANGEDHKLILHLWGEYGDSLVYHYKPDKFSIKIIPEDSYKKYSIEIIPSS
jgi:hypothetical protein